VACFHKVHKVAAAAAAAAAVVVGAAAVVAVMIVMMKLGLNQCRVLRKHYMHLSP
jgi:hypothetical protein